MISPANHRHRSESIFRAGSRKCPDNGRSTLCRRVGVNDLFGDRNLPLCRNRLARGFDRAHRSVTPLKIRIANVERQLDAARNAIDGARKHVANAHSRDCINRAARLHRVFNREDQFRRGAQRVSAVRHKHRTSVPARAFDRNSEASRSSNARDDAEWNFLLLEQWPLLDVQLHKCFVVAARQFHFFERCAVSSIAADLLKRSAFFVDELSCRIRSHRSRKQPAAETTDSEASWLFGCKHEQLDRMLRTEAAALQGTNCFQSTEHANNAVILSSVGNCVYVRTSSHHRSIWLRSEE